MQPLDKQVHDRVLRVSDKHVIFNIIQKNVVIHENSFVLKLWDRITKKKNATEVPISETQ